MQLAEDRSEIVALLIQHGVTSVPPAVENPQDEGIAGDSDLTTIEQGTASLSFIENQLNEDINTEPGLETAISETQPLLGEPTLNENATVIPETLSPIAPGMGLMEFLPPASY